jgi:hypothetical protein
MMGRCSRLLSDLTSRPSVEPASLLPFAICASVDSMQVSVPDSPVLTSTMKTCRNASPDHNPIGYDAMERSAPTLLLVGMLRPKPVT